MYVHAILLGVLVGTSINATWSLSAHDPGIACICGGLLFIKAWRAVEELVRRVW